MSDTVLFFFDTVLNVGPTLYSHDLSYDNWDPLLLLQKFSHLGATVNIYCSYSNIFLFTLTDLVNKGICS